MRRDPRDSESRAWVTRGDPKEGKRRPRAHQRPTSDTHPSLGNQLLGWGAPRGGPLDMIYQTIKQQVNARDLNTPLGHRPGEFPPLYGYPGGPPESLPRDIPGTPLGDLIGDLTAEHWWRGGQVANPQPRSAHLSDQRGPTGGTKRRT